MPEYQRYRVLWPLVPAMAMVMIDFTIVSISATHDPAGTSHLSETAVQWLVTAYALSTAAFVALGGRLGDILGHRRIVDRGVIVFAGSSLICGLVPDSESLAEPWLIVFRVLQGVGGGLLIPSATVLVLDAFPGEERGKGLSVFFIVAGLFTAIGPIAGSYLTEYWTWRAIFWINVPVALLALIEFYFAKLNDVKHPARGSTGAAPSCSSPEWALPCSGSSSRPNGAGATRRRSARSSSALLVLVAFVAVERNTEDPLIDVNAMAPTGPSRSTTSSPSSSSAPGSPSSSSAACTSRSRSHQEPTQAGFSILTMFYSFFVASRIGGGWMDKFGPKKPVVLGFAARRRSG